jgi:DNA-binding transcriptional ArsR family regulator
MSLVSLFSALADQTRSRVVEMLHVRPRPVHELAAAFDISRPAISRHLKVLKDAGLVVEEKTGRENVYTLQRSKLKPMQDWLDRHRSAKGAKARSVVGDVAAPAPVEPVPDEIAVAKVVEPVGVEPVAAAPAKPKRAPKTGATKTGATKTGATKIPRTAEALSPPPPATPAPQLSFFDL